MSGFTKEQLKEEVDRIWGPYSQQAIVLRSLIRENEEKRKEPLTQQERRSQNQEVDVVTSTVFKGTLTYFFTRAFFILAVWFCFAVFLGICAGIPILMHI